MPDLISDCCYEDYKDRKRENQERVVEETLEAPEKSKQNLTLQQKMWNSFENPQVSSVALVFYYVTGFFIAVSVLSNIIGESGFKTRSSLISYITKHFNYGNEF